MFDSTSYIRAGWFSPPGNTISDVSEERGWTRCELAKRLNLDEQAIDGLIRGDIPLSQEIACRLERVLGSTAAFWMRREARYREGRELESNGGFIIEPIGITPIGSIDPDAAIEGAWQAIDAANQSGEPLDRWPGRAEALCELDLEEDDDRLISEIAADLLAHRIESSRYLTYDKPLRDGGSWVDTDSQRSYDIIAHLALSPTLR